MLNIIESSKKNIYAIGDIHGEFKALGNWIREHSLRDCDIIFCGDFGLGFDSIQKEHQDLLRAEKACEANNVTCYIVRGNHDNPDYYNTTKNLLDLRHIQPLSDYSVIKYPHHGILCLGGAISTDRSCRISNYDLRLIQYKQKKHCSFEEALKHVKECWWEGEPFYYNEIILEEIVDLHLPIDTICSHCAPDFCFPTTSPRVIYWEAQDATLKQDLEKERENLTKLYKYLQTKGVNISNWYYGHYHGHNSEIIDNTKFTLLDMGRNGRMSGNSGGYFDMVELT